MLNELNKIQQDDSFKYIAEFLFLTTQLGVLFLVLRCGRWIFFLGLFNRTLIIIIIIIIIILFINCNWVVTRWQWLFYVHTNIKKKSN